MSDILEKTADAVAGKYLVQEGRHADLRSMPTEDHGKLDKTAVQSWLRKRRVHLAALQERRGGTLHHAVLLVLQGMDASGKDSLIRAVMTGMNPQGTKVVSFKKPSDLERAHDYLWRVHLALPERGQVGVFNRSHYEDVLVARVHADTLDTRGLWGKAGQDAFWTHRLKDIKNFEAYAGRQGLKILKVMLHMSPECQQKRLLRRLRRPEKRWKFDESDLVERDYWGAYQAAYQEAIAATATAQAPWLVVPADKKWYARLVVMEAMIHVLEQGTHEEPEAPPAIANNVKALEAKILASTVKSSGKAGRR